MRPYSRTIAAKGSVFSVSAFAVSVLPSRDSAEEDVDSAIGFEVELEDGLSSLEVVGADDVSSGCDSGLTALVSLRT